MADIVTFDPAYFQELIKDLEGASQSLISAQDSLQKASVGLDSGLVAFAMCCTLNDDIKKVKKTAEGFLDEASGLSRALTGGVMRVNGWENTTKSKESGLASQLGKTWGFEGGNFAGGTSSGAGNSSGNAAGGTPSTGAADTAPEAGMSARLADDTDDTKKPWFDPDWTSILSFAGGMEGMRRAALENAIKDAVWAAGLGVALGSAAGPAGLAAGATTAAAGGFVEGAVRSAIEGQGVEQGTLKGMKVGAALDGLENAGFSIFDLLIPSETGDSARQYLTEALNKL